MVTAGQPFDGCTGLPPPPDEEVIARVNVTNLEAHLINGVIEILGVIAVKTDSLSFSLNITATVAIDTIIPHIAEAIAEYLGGAYTASDVHVQIVTKRIANGSVIVTLDSGHNSGHNLVSSVFVLLSLLLALLI